MFVKENIRLRAVYSKKRIVFGNKIRLLRWADAEHAVPLTEHERALNSKGLRRGETDWRWASADLVAAGWLRKSPDGSGKWVISESGIQALREFSGDELFAEAQRRYAVGDERQRATAGWMRPGRRRR